MYVALKHTHTLLSLLGLLATLAWLVVAWRGAASPSPELSGKTRLCYILNRALVGLAGLSGIVLTGLGPWLQMLFPYLGLAAFIIHGLAAAASKKAWGSGRERFLRGTLLIQVLALLVAAALMAVKPL